MTEPLKPTDYINFGGVKFNSNDIAQKQTLIKENGAVRYSVFLRNGVHLEYPEQKAENNASVWGVDEGKLETSTFIKNVAYGQVKGTQKSDVISLSGNNGTIVDVTGDDNNTLGDSVFISDTKKDGYYGDYMPQNKFTPSKNNKIITGKKDNIKIETQNTNVWVDGAGTTTETSLKGIKRE